MTTEPFYKDENITLYCGDVLRILPELNVKADLLVTDPPYGVDWRGRSAQDRSIANDNKSFSLRVAFESILKRVRRGRHCYIFGYEPDESLNIAAVTKLIWDKSLIGLGGAHCWSKSFEEIYFGVHEISKANRAKGYGRKTARLRRESVIAVQRQHSAGIKNHPTEKPVQLIRQLIESSSLFGEIVLDPFAGSGSTLVAASLEGRKAIGIELEEKYCEIAVRRLTNDKANSQE